MLFPPYLGAMSTIATALAAFALLALGGGFQPATAAEGARCSGTLIILLDPGFSMEPSAGTHRSEAPSALQCTGAVNGQAITGPGTLFDEGPYGTVDPDSCTAGSEGTGIDHITVPTAEGPQTIESHYSYEANKAATGPLRGEFTGSRYSGTFEIRVLEGDCVTQPVTKLELRIEGVLV